MLARDEARVHRGARELLQAGVILRNSAVAEMQPELLREGPARRADSSAR